MKIEILDTTLRDGEQGAGIEFSPDDKLKVIKALDELGVSYIEAGMITNESSARFFESLRDVKTENARLAVFTRTCKPGEEPCCSDLLKAAAGAPVPVATIYGKAWLYQVTEVLRTSPEENLRLIRKSIEYLRDCGKEVIFDAEHFFDGYSDSPDYAMSVVDTAFSAGASRVVLCDTNGGNLPDVIGLICQAVCEKYPNIGIHCHNDMGMAAACTVSAVLAGASHIHVTVSGMGERCGNANLNTVVPVLQLKMGFQCLGDRIKDLTRTARTVNECANIAFDEKEPFVGGYAFTHKAGSHIDGVMKSPKAYEQISPGSVGNARNLLVSGLSGRSAVIEKMENYLSERNLGLTKDDPQVKKALEAIKERESRGYEFEDAGASLALTIDDALGNRKSYFTLLGLKVIIDEAGSIDNTADEPFTASAVIKIAVDGKEYLTAGEGNGPVNAIDEALRRALVRFYPEIATIKLTDYRVRVLDSRATASSVRVSIETTDGVSVWRTIGVSEDVINASWQALRDSMEYIIRKTQEKKTEL